ncbi:MAG: glycosyltransferase 87 family protein [Candidatus Nezhaarchaeales archaeon]
MLGERRRYTLIVGYALVIATSYAVPIGLRDTEWYSFYSYLDSRGATPYVDVREGYPPLGFLVYMPLYYAFRDSVEAFSYAFRALNGALLTSCVFVLYMILRTRLSEWRSVELAFCYAALPSVLIANLYSNDVVALLPSALAVYAMLRGKPIACGLLIGIAGMSKGFPLLLLVPALLMPSRLEQKVKVLGSALAALMIVSLPFMLMNPYTYTSTFTHVGSRGPWETIWALLDGYYSHGGFLHPYFDKFFYHQNLLEIYAANHYDHAVYKWSIGWMPTLLTACQAAAVASTSIAYLGRRERLLQFCGALYVAYMFFFKGYSTQFAVSTPFYVLLASLDRPVPYLAALEVSHILQMLAWGSELVAPGVLRDWHVQLLVASIALRTAVLGLLVAVNFKDALTGLRDALHMLRRMASTVLRTIMDLRLLLLASAAVLALAASVGAVYLNAEENVYFAHAQGSASLSRGEHVLITLAGLRRGDQVAVKLTTNSWFDVEASSGNLNTYVERAVRNPFNLKGSFNETLFFFIAESESYNVTLKPMHPPIPFRVTDGFQGDLDLNVSGGEGFMVFELRDRGVDGKDSIFRVAYPVAARVDDDFTLTLRYEVLEGEPKLLLDVFDDVDEWVYCFETTKDFTLKPESRDIHGRSNLRGDPISLIALVVCVRDGSSVVVKLDEVKLVSSEGVVEVPLMVGERETVTYEVYVERDWEPPPSYRAALMAFAALCAASFICLHERAKQIRGNT